MDKWYKSLFENFGQKYEDEGFTHGTLGECDFIEQELNFEKNLKILDIGCGTGRHSIELAKRGYCLTGIDLSESMLNKAKQKAESLKLKVDFHQMDARKLPYVSQFDVALMLCEGAFPLMETDEMNFEILQCASQALKPGGKFIFTTLNGLFALYHSVQEFCNTSSLEGNTTYSSNSFDLMTFRDYNLTTFIDDSGITKELECNERYYVPSELTWLLKATGFKVVDIYGAKLGAFSRTDKLTTEDFEMLVIAQKH